MTDWQCSCHTWGTSLLGKPGPEGWTSQPKGLCRRDTSPDSVCQFQSCPFVHRWTQTAEICYRRHPTPGRTLWSCSSSELSGHSPEDCSGHRSIWWWRCRHSTSDCWYQWIAGAPSSKGSPENWESPHILYCLFYMPLTLFALLYQNCIFCFKWVACGMINLYQINILWCVFSHDGTCRYRWIYSPSPFQMETNSSLRGSHQVHSTSGRCGVAWPGYITLGTGCSCWARDIV